MNHLVGLPWRIASLAGLLVGGISLLTGAGLWTCLLRVAAAFAVFAVAGWGLQTVLQQPVLPGEPPLRGTHFDQTTPEVSPDEPASSPGDTRS